MYKQIKQLADEAIALQNKDRMDAALREISALCDQQGARPHHEQSEPFAESELIVKGSPEPLPELMSAAEIVPPVGQPAPAPHGKAKKGGAK